MCEDRHTTRKERNAPHSARSFSVHKLPNLFELILLLELNFRSVVCLWMCECVYVGIIADLLRPVFLQGCS